MSSSIADVAAPSPKTASGSPLVKADVTESTGFSRQSSAFAPAVRNEQAWASAIVMVQSAAKQIQRYEHAMRTMANDVIRITFRSNAEKDALEKAVENAEQKLEALQAEHQLALDLLGESQVLCLALKGRLENFEDIPAEIERDFHHTLRYISKLKHAAARRQTVPI